MIKLINLLKEISYSFSEYDTTYDDEDNSLIDVEYTFKTEKNTYKVIFSSKEKAREFEVSFGIDTGNFNKIDTFQMTGNLKTKKWIEKVIKSSNTWDQLTTCEKLIQNFKNQMDRFGYDRMLALPYITDLEYKIQLKRTELIESKNLILNN